MTHVKAYEAVQELQILASARISSAFERTRTIADWTRPLAGLSLPAYSSVRVLKSVYTASLFVPEQTLLSPLLYLVLSLGDSTLRQRLARLARLPDSSSFSLGS